MKPTINFCLRTSSYQNVLCKVIYMRITIKRKSKFYTTGISVFPEFWDRNKQRIMRRDHEHQMKNDLIEKQYYKAKDIIYNIQLSKQEISLDIFHQFYTKDSYPGKIKLTDFLRTFIKEKTGILAQNTIDKYINCAVKIDLYSPGILLSGIDYNFLAGYENYLRTQRNNSHNTVAKDIKILKMLFNEAKRRNLIKQDKTLNYSISYKEVTKDILTIDELKSLALLIDNPYIAVNMKRVLFYFVFAAFTGLRISDIVKLKISDFKEDFKYIDIITAKTKDRLILPLSNPAQALIFKYIDFDERLKNDFKNTPFFNVFSEQYSRIILRDAAKIAGVNKYLTFHTARYTFATICNTLNIPIEITSRLLSHKSLKMTLKYAKFSDRLLTDNINKWNDILK